MNWMAFVAGVGSVFAAALIYKVSKWWVREQASDVVDDRITMRGYMKWEQMEPWVTAICARLNALEAKKGSGK